jgi:ElaB/YqjD/DUF883 family membrane-anchored ribosome-binding protein
LDGKEKNAMANQPKRLSNEEEVKRLLKAREIAHEQARHEQAIHAHVDDEEAETEPERIIVRSHEKTDQTADQGHEKTDQTADRAQHATESGREGMHRAADRGHQLADQVADSIQSTIEHGRAQTHDRFEAARERAHESQHSGQGKVEEAKVKAQQAGTHAHAKADSGMTATGERVENAAHNMRERSPQGKAGNIAGRIADTMEHSGKYLQQSNPNDMRSDMEQLIRKHPVESLLIGAGVGFLLSRMTRRR